MRPHESIWTAWSARVLAALTALSACVLTARTAQAAAVRAETQDSLSALDAARASRALDASRGAGPAAAVRALDDFAAGGVVERRLRARVIRTEAGAAQWSRVLELTGDPDSGVRMEIAATLGRPDRAGEAVAERVRALTTLAEEDADAGVRAAARVGLGTLGAVDALARLADRAPRGERAAALTELAGRPEGRAAAFDRLEMSDVELVAAARLAIEGAWPDAEAAVLARITDGLARGSVTAAVALERAVRRLVQLGAVDRALQILVRIDDPAAAELRARIALNRARDPAAASSAADALARAIPMHESSVDGLLRDARAVRYRACARLAAGSIDAETRDRLRASRGNLAVELARRRDRGGAAATGEHLALLDELAQLDLCDAVLALADASPPDPARAVDAAFALYTAALHAHAAGARAEISTADGLDVLLGAEDSAVDLVLEGEPVGDLDPARQLAIRLALGRALATAAGAEMVGFEPLSAFVDDPRRTLRRGLLEEVLRAELDRAQVRHARAAFASERARSTRPAGASAAQRREELETRLVLQNAWEDLATLADGDEAPLLDARTASWFAVTSARRLRDAGHGPEARDLLGRARQELEASGAAQRWLWGIEITAEIEAAIGASYTDDEEPQRAEVELQRAVDRLQALEDLLRERGAPARAIESVRSQRASALVSLAVNANVRMHQPESALEYFERAWSIRKDEFSRALLACYRARSGRTAEARELLAIVAPGPGTYYNLACTYALLGERDTAFHWLEMEMHENHATGGSLERQQAWARKDPDLASLRDDPRFRALVGG